MDLSRDYAGQDGRTGSGTQKSTATKTGFLVHKQVYSLYLPLICRKSGKGWQDVLFFFLQWRRLYDINWFNRRGFAIFPPRKMSSCLLKILLTNWNNNRFGSQPKNILRFYLLRRTNMSKKLFFEVFGIIFFVEDCSRQARIMEMVKVIRARCTKVFVPVENNNVLARSQRKF
jgi:hypothetical protein